MGLFFELVRLHDRSTAVKTNPVNVAAERIAAKGGEVKDFKFQMSAASSTSHLLYVGIVYEAPASIDSDR